MREKRDQIVIDEQEDEDGTKRYFLFWKPFENGKPVVGLWVNFSGEAGRLTRQEMLDFGPKAEDIAYVEKMGAKLQDGWDCGSYWKTKARAQKALKKIQAGRPKLKRWPDWAVKAKAAGWMPPKGWTP